MLNGSDLNLGSVNLNVNSGVWAKKSFEFWFNANSVPARGTNELSSTATLYEEGGGTRGIALYLWQSPTNLNPNSAQLVFHGWNSALDGPAPWGATNGLGLPSPTPPVYAQTAISAGQTYHVVGVLDGDPVSTNGNLILYVNGVEVSRAGGAGQLYAHSGDIEIARGNTLLHTGDSGVTGYFDGVIDDLSLYDTALPASSVAAHYQAGTNAVVSATPLVVSRLDTLGNPNQILLTFNKAVTQTTATNRANYGLTNAAGTAIKITSANLLGGDSTVQLLGNFGFLVSSNYTLTVSNITDRSVPANTLSPNPTNLAFSFSAPAGTTYSFNSWSPSGVQVIGGTYVTNNGSFDGSGYIDLTDATTNENGAVLFTDRHDVTQAHITFKARLSSGSTPPGAGFSVNIGTDLPTSTFSNPEQGYLPAPIPNVPFVTNRLVVAFNNQNSHPPSISVLWQENTLTNVPTGINGVPPLASTDGHWANVDINLLPNGLISVSYDGVTVITNLPTGFQPLKGAQVSIAARTTTTTDETHWFDNVNLNFADGDIGPVTIPASGQPQGSVYLENQPVNLIVTPAGAAPYGYQWYFNTNTLVFGATNRNLTFFSSKTNGGTYTVNVWNSFSSVTSAPANIVVQSDLLPAAVTNVAAYGGGVNKVIVTFNKWLDPVSSTNLANYSINSGGVLIYNAILNPDNASITLFTSQQQNLTTNTLAIHNLLNYAVNPTALTTNVTFRTGISYYQEALADNPVRYYRFDETNGKVAVSDVSVLDTPVQAQGSYSNNPTLGLPPLFTNSPGTSVRLNGSLSNYISFVAIQKDVSGTNTGGGIIYTNRTVEFWFKANSLPYAEADQYGNVTNNHAPPLWTEGANARYLCIYLYGTDTTTTNPSSALLAINAANLIGTDGSARIPPSPGLGTPWGTTNGFPQWACWVGAPVTTNMVYHVVGELQGSNVIGGGEILLYTNGVLVGTDKDGTQYTGGGGAGYLYGHSGAAPRVGLGANGCFRQDGILFSAGGLC